MSKRNIFYSTAMQEALVAQFEKNPDYVYFGEDVGHMGGTLFKNGLFERFGAKRCVEMPIAENLIVASAMGASVAGMRGVAELMYSDFITLAMDPIVNEAPKYRFNAAGKASVPMTVITFSGTLDGSGCVHSQCTESWIANTPGLKLVTPSTAADAKGLLSSALKDDDPVVFLAGRACMFTKGDVSEDDYEIPLGKARIAREGRDVTVVAWHRAYLDAMAVAEELEKEEGIQVEVIDPRTLIPFDYDSVLQSVKKTGRLIVASEAPKRYSCTGEIASYVAEHAFDDLKKAPVRLGSPNTPIPSFQLEDSWRLNQAEIKQAILNIVK